MATLNQEGVNEARALEVIKAITIASTAFSGYPNGSVGLFIHYVGSSALAAVAVAAGGDLAFTADDVDGLTDADTSVGLPTLDGTIDVSDASANTMAEVRDNINASADWECYLGDVLPTWSSNNTMTTLTAANSQDGTGTGTDGVQAEGGVALMLDPATSDVLYDGGTTFVVPVKIGHDAFNHRGDSFDEVLSAPAGHLENQKFNRCRSAFANITSAAAGAGDILFEVWIAEPDDTVRRVFGPQSTAVASAAASLDMLPEVDQLVKGEQGQAMVALFKTATAVITACQVTIAGRSTRRGYSQVAQGGDA